MANNVGSALSALLASGQTFYAPFADKGSGEVSLVASGAGASQTPTFTRATTATTVNSAGLIVSVASGTPRSYYDPTTLAYLGYLAEGARTNIALQSSDFSTTWGPASAANAAVVTDVATAPDGTTTADKIDEKATTADHYFIQTTTSTAATHVFSIFLKQAERTKSWIYINTAANAIAWFDLSAGTVGTVSGSGSPSATIKAYPNGWYRCTLTATAPLNSVIGFGPTTTDNVTVYAGAANTGIYAWGAQLEAGSFASSYIPTTTASVTRNADVLTYPFAGNASASVGSCYAEVSTLWSGLTFASMIVDFTVGVDSIYPLGVIANGAPTSITMTDGTTTANKSGLSSMFTAQRKRASSWGGSGLIITGDGAAPATAAFDGDIGSTAIGIGCGTNGAENLFGTIRNVRIFQTQLSSGQLSGITA